MEKQPHTLYGDGVHDDAPAIQAMLDSGTCVVALPPPEAHYCIGSTLVIHSGQTLTLHPTARIQLMPGSDCLMLRNAREDAPDHDISVLGGIWDYNNLHQTSNPFLDGSLNHLPSHRDGNPDTILRYHEEYMGVCMRFWGVTRLNVRNMTFKDPITYCLQIGDATYFTVENIQFDMNHGNPHPINMDGVHLDGGCRFGSIRNVKGTCYDDIVALNADDSHDGPIEDIEIDGIFGEHSLRGVRLQSTKSPVRRISIANIFGTFYQNCLGLTYFYKRSGGRGEFDHITVRNVYGGNAPRLPLYHKPPAYEFSFIFVESDVHVGRLTVEHLYRNETAGDIETLIVSKNADVGVLSLSHVTQENHTGVPYPMIRNEGTIGTLYLYDVHAGEDTLLENNGVIGKTVAEEA